MSGAVQLYVVRHGETAWSLSGQHTGRSEIALTADGEAAARGLAPLLAQVGFDRVFSSPRVRARRTCELAGLGERMQLDAELAEWDYGDDEGKRSDDIRAERPGWDTWRDGFAGGEPLAALSDRADRVIARLSGLGGNVAVFSHGHFGCALVTRWIGLPIACGQHFLLDPASVTILGAAPRHPGVRVLRLLNGKPESRWP